VVGDLELLNGHMGVTTRTVRNCTTDTNRIGTLYFWVPRVSNGLPDLADDSQDR
jgi:hypothetical protein